MNNTWLKIKAWTKGIVLGLLLLYIVLFIYKNSGAPVTFWWWFNHSPTTTVFLLALFAFCAGILTSIIVRTMWRTYRQVREMRHRGRTEKLERDVADMHAKAAMLQTRQPGASSEPNMTVHVDKLGGGS